MADSIESAGEVTLYVSIYQDRRCRNLILETLAEISKDKFALFPVSVASGPIIQPKGYDCGAYAAVFILHQMELLATSSSSSNVTAELSTSDKLSEELVFALRVMLALCENYFNALYAVVRRINE